MPRLIAAELLWSFLAIGVITAAYAATVFVGGVPSPSGWLGHGIGIIGFLMMLSTEVLYTLRKRVRGLTLGPTNAWLQAHFFTGIVGPYLVLLHSAGKFNGLAGVVSLLTVLMVLSGFVGRYLYTAAPRSLDGVEVDIAQLREQLAEVERQLGRLSEPGRQALAAPAPPVAWLAVLLCAALLWRYRRRLRRNLARLSPDERAIAAPLAMPLVERYRLVLLVHSLAATRRLLALWHLMHVPLGGVLFGLALLHIGAALYYATFLK